MDRDTDMASTARGTHARTLAGRAIGILAGVLAALVIAIAAITVGPAPQAHADGSTWAGDQSLEHLSSSLAGWYAKATNIDNNTDARYGPAKYTDMEGERKPDCGGDAGKGDGKCSLDNQWSDILANPATAGDFIGFYRQDYSNTPLGGTVNRNSNASQGYMYKAMRTSSTKGDGFRATERQGPAAYAYYGAALQSLGLDSTSLPGSRGLGRWLTGFALLLAYLLAMLVTVLFQLALSIIRYVNPGTYLLPAFNSAHDNRGYDGVGSLDPHPQWVTGAGIHFTALDPIMERISGVAAVFSGFGLFITIPAIIFLTIFMMALWRSRNTEANHERANRTLGMSLKRVGVIFLGLGLLLPLVTGVLNSISVQPLPAAGTSELMQSLLVDTGDWARYNALAVPKSVSKEAITYSRTDGQVQPASVINELSTARAINQSIRVPRDPTAIDSHSVWDAPYLPVCTTSDAGPDTLGLNRGSLGGGGASSVKFGDGGILNDDSYDGSDLYNANMPNCRPKESFGDSLRTVQTTAGLAMSYATGETLTASQYGAYVNAVIQGTAGAKHDKEHNYTPASQFIAPDYAGDTNTAMNLLSSQGMCSAASGGQSGGNGGDTGGGSGGTQQTGSQAAAPQACKGDGAKYVEPRYNGLLSVASPGTPRAPSLAVDPGGLKMSHVDGQPGIYQFWTNQDTDTCDLSPLASGTSGPGSLTKCNMSPLTEYNYLSSVFGDTSVAVYSAGNSTSDTQVPVHYNVSMVGTAGFDRIANGLYVGSLMGMLALVGLGFVLAMCIQGCRSSVRAVMSVPGMMFGVASQAGRFIISLGTLVIVVMGTYFMWMVTGAVYSYLPDLVPDVYNMITSVASNGGRGTMLTESGDTIATFAKLAIALIVIALGLWLMRIRDAMVSGLSDGLGDLVGRFLRMDQNKAHDDARVTSSSEVLQHAAGVAGFVAGAGMTSGVLRDRIGTSAGPVPVSGAGGPSSSSSSASGGMPASGVNTSARMGVADATATGAPGDGASVANAMSESAPGEGTAQAVSDQTPGAQASAEAGQAVPAAATLASAAAAGAPSTAPAQAVAMATPGTQGSANLGVADASPSPSGAGATAQQASAATATTGAPASSGAGPMARSATATATGAAGTAGMAAPTPAGATAGSTAEPGVQTTGSAELGTSEETVQAYAASTPGTMGAAGSAGAQAHADAAAPTGMPSATATATDALPGVQTTGSAGLGTDAAAPAAYGPTASAPATASANAMQAAGVPQGTPTAEATATTPGMQTTGSAGLGTTTAEPSTVASVDEAGLPVMDAAGTASPTAVGSAQGATSTAGQPMAAAPGTATSFARGSMAQPGLGVSDATPAASTAPVAAAPGVAAPVAASAAPASVAPAPVGVMPTASPMAAPGVSVSGTAPAAAATVTPGIAAPPTIMPSAAPAPVPSPSAMPVPASSVPTLAVDGTAAAPSVPSITPVPGASPSATPSPVAPRPSAPAPVPTAKPMAQPRVSVDGGLDA